MMMMMIDSGGLLSNARRSDGSFQSQVASPLVSSAQQQKSAQNRAVEAVSVLPKYNH
jgi:hypothetical protein